MDKKEALKQRLEKLPRKSIVAFAVRCAWRAMPYAGAEGHFNFWKGDANKHMQAVFTAVEETHKFCLLDIAADASAADKQAFEDIGFLEEGEDLQIFFQQPLWKEPPEGWKRILQNWKVALQGVGLTSLYQQYQQYTKGELPIGKSKATKSINPTPLRVNTDGVSGEDTLAREPLARALAVANCLGAG